MALWRFLDYRTDDVPPRSPIRVWYGQQDLRTQAAFDAAVKTLAAVEDWKKTKLFKVLDREHAGLAEIRFSVRRKKASEPKIRRFRPLGIWNEEAKEFVFLTGCEKAHGIYDPPDAFDVALKYKSKLATGEGDTYEHY